MEALKTWMLNTGLNPDILPYILGTIILIVILLVYVSVRKKSSEPDTGSAPQAKVEAETAPEPLPEPVPEPESTAETAAQITVETAPVEVAETVDAPDSPQVAVEEIKPEEPLKDAPGQVAELATEPPAEQPTEEPEEEPKEEPKEEVVQAPIAEVGSAPAVAAEPIAESEQLLEPEQQAEPEPESKPETKPEPVVAAQEVAEAPEVRKKRLFERIKSGLSRTKANLTAQLSDLFSGSSEIDDDLLEEIETLLLMSDVGVDATTEIIGKLTDRVERKQLKDPQALRDALKQELKALLGGAQQGLPVVDNKPMVILMVGVNGVGKTTTIGKLTKRFQMEGKSVMLAAGDTFRAAAVEQLQVWGERNKVPVIAQHTGADSASVIFDALQSAKAKGIDVLIADTAGRLQNKDNLMQELAKVVRVMQKLDPTAPHEVMLVLDAGTGQNAISQAREFKEAVGVTGITMTKLDGTAKGGIIFAVAKQFDLPIRFIGVGEQLDDLRPFDADEFVDALFD
ncbi:signal recognition particle-docking protein FtsY [Nitrincola alkalilacustris]|uniref:signal recognition particle-docking protein FtsY n=1 Tax=Nitrincola alkalilacustris TaxID=1571224 RepID=UPI001F0D1867|nr:signal recognition particle-docking protein FtsY [Nitrincola alkalilacustris]